MRAKSLVAASLLFCFWLTGNARPPALTETQKITHLLNRAAFGPRPGDVERVQRMGIAAYIDQQLHPERIDDSLADVRLSFFASTQMDTARIFENYPDQQMVARQLGLQPAQLKGEEQAAARQKVQQYVRENGIQQPAKLLQELSGHKVVRAVYSERQLQEVMADFWFNHFNVDWSKGQDRWLTTGFEMKSIRPNALGKFKDLLMATAQSPAMMFYLDNHLSTAPDPRVAARAQAAQAKRKPGINENYARELMELHTMGVDGGYTQKDVQEVARALTGWTLMNERVAKAANASNPLRGGDAAEAAPRAAGGANALGRVAKVLGGAQSPAGVASAAAGQAAQALRRQKGRDAQTTDAEMAAEPGEFLFRPMMHDREEKVVLGHTLKANRGIEDGEEVIDILAHHPSTARFIATKLVRRFVSDDPPKSLVDRVAATFMKTDGDIREMLRVIFTSDEFYAPEAWQAKMKSPFELTASSLRLLEGVTDGGQQLVRMVSQMGQPLYQYAPPTGFPDSTEQWMSSGALVERINFGVALASNRIPGTRVSLAAFNNDPKVAALHLGSPEFQKR